MGRSHVRGRQTTHRDLAGRDEQGILEDVSTLRQVLDQDLLGVAEGAPFKPVLVVLSGLPGTGKSYFAQRLARRAPFLVISSDRMRKALVDKPRYTRGEHARVFAACHYLVEEYLGRGWPVIFDATNLTEGHRRPLYEIARRLGVPVAVVYFTADRETVKHRLEERAAGRSPAGHSDADWCIYCRLSPGEEPVQGPHFIVDTGEDFSLVIEEILQLAAP